MPQLHDFRSGRQWMPVQGFPGFLASDDGLVFAQSRFVMRSNGISQRLRSKIVKPYKGIKAHSVRIGSVTDGTRTTMNVGAAVLSAFAGARPYGMECCHNDGDPSNNNLQNLRWDTKYANEQDKLKHGTRPFGDRNGRRTKPWATARGERNGNARLTNSKAADVRRRVLAGETQASVARSIGVPKGLVSRIARGKTYREVG